LSKAIRLITRGTFSHTALVMVLDGELMIVDSQYDGTRIRCIDEWNLTYGYEVVITRPSKEVQLKLHEISLIKKVKPYLNTKYGYVDLLRHILLNYTGIWIGSKREDKNLVCSEFVLNIYGAKNAYRSNPQDAYVWCLENDFVILEP